MKSDILMSTAFKLVVIGTRYKGISILLQLGQTSSHLSFNLYHCCTFLLHHHLWGSIDHEIHVEDAHIDECYQTFPPQNMPQPSIFSLFLLFKHFILLNVWNTSSTVLHRIQKHKWESSTSFSRVLLGTNQHCKLLRLLPVSWHVLRNNETLQERCCFWAIVTQ